MVESCWSDGWIEAINDRIYTPSSIYTWSKMVYLSPFPPPCPYPMPIKFSPPLQEKKARGKKSGGEGTWFQAGMPVLVGILSDLQVQPLNFATPTKIQGNEENMLLFFLPIFFLVVLPSSSHFFFWNGSAEISLLCSFFFILAGWGWLGLILRNLLQPGASKISVSLNPRSWIIPGGLL